MGRKPKVAGLELAVELAGGPVALARELGIAYQSVQHWRKVGGLVPATQAPLIESLTGGRVRCEEICPSVRWDLIRG
jgi:DNA-binding transcriptional regulator YdaS (Cro superfamily)